MTQILRAQGDHARSEVRFAKGANANLSLHFRTPSVNATLPPRAWSRKVETGFRIRSCSKQKNLPDATGIDDRTAIALELLAQLLDFLLVAEEIAVVVGDL